MFLISKLKIIVKCYLEYRKKVTAWKTRNIKINYIICFNIKELENKLRIGDILESTFFNYLLANSIIFTTFYCVPSSEYTMKWVLAIEIVLGVAITIIGIKTTFIINSAGYKKVSLGRFLSLSFVIGIR